MKTKQTDVDDVKETTGTSKDRTNGSIVKILFSLTKAFNIIGKL